MKTSMIILLVVVVVLIGWWFLSRGSMHTTNGQLLGSSEFITTLATYSGAVILDVRTPGEYASGHMKGAVNIDIQNASFGNQIAKLDTAGTYFVYCHSGRRSAVAVAQMQQKGFANIYELASGASAAPQLMSER